jgi:hypothetical protein
MRIRKQLFGIGVAVVLALGLSAVPAHATVHEIVAQWCSGQDPLEPHGVSRDGSKNFAQPLRATRVLIMTVDPVAETVLITFDYNHPAVKVQSSGLTIPIGETPDGFTLLLDVPEPNPDFPAFRHCPALGF